MSDSMLGVYNQVDVLPYKGEERRHSRVHCFWFSSLETPLDPGGKFVWLRELRPCACQLH